MPPKRQFTYTGKFTGKSTNKSSFAKRSYNNDDDEGSSKRFKSSAATAKPPDGARHVDEEGNFYWELGGNRRRVTVSEFRGNVLVSVREYYEKDGKQLPGNKGISLSLDQFNQLIKVLPALEEAIGQKTTNGVVRPIYTTSAKHDAPKGKSEKSKPEIDSEDDEEEEKVTITAKKEEEEDEDEEEEQEDSDVEEKKPSKKSKKENTKAKDDKKSKTKKRKVVDSEEEEEEEEEYQEDSEED